MRCPDLRTVVTIVALGALPLFSGCAAATLATAGTFAGIAATVVTTGADVYHLGKLDSVELAKQDEMIAAVRAMAKELNLAIVEEKWESDHVWYAKLSDDLGSTTGVTIDSRTETMARARINVGIFGSEPTARLMLLRLREHLPALDKNRPGATTAPAVTTDPRETPPDDETRPKIRKPPRQP